jgi:hypothetical protein
MGATATAPSYSRNFRRSIRTCSKIHLLTSEMGCASSEWSAATDTFAFARTYPTKISKWIKAWPGISINFREVQKKVDEDSTN